MNLETKMDILFDAFAEQDVEQLRSLCAPTFVARRNGEGASDFGEMIAGVKQAFWSAGIKSSYSNIRRVVGESSVAEQHHAALVGDDGVELVLDVCVVVHFDGDGLVLSLDEYADTAPLGQLFRRSS